MDSGPFGRRSWATQSLRVTAKELSLSGRGKHNAIAERFSKYQKAAEESSAEKKKPASGCTVSARDASQQSSNSSTETMKKHKATDSVVSSVRSANLSALKKRWEQPSAPPPAQPVPRSRTPAASRPVPLLQGGRQERQPPAGGQASQGEGGMDSDELTHRERAEMPEEQVPSSPRGSYEKARVPLNNLKMKFERGDGAPSKAGRTTLRSSSSDDADQHGGPSVFDRVLESTSTKERMAKYQAAVFKQSGAQPDVTPEALALRASASADQKGGPAPHCNGESGDQAKALRKFSPPARETCIACLKTVYPLERLVALQHVYHKHCFRCLHCKMTLSLGNYASLHGSIYCKPHFSQLFKTKGNYDEGFGLRPHKELWEPRTDGEEGEESAKPREREEAAVATRAARGSSEEQPPEEESPPVKVTDLTALLESRAQTKAGATVQSRERAAEARRLRVAWPPPAAEGHAGTAALSPVTEGTASGRPFKAKWPPEDEGPSVPQSSDRAELVTLRRSSSLKERSRPFTIAARPSPAPSLAPRERRPLKSLLEWRASLEEKSAPEEPPKEQEPSGNATKDAETPPRRQEEAAADDAKGSEDGSLRSISPDISPSPSPPSQPKQNRASQDVGFWEGGKEGSDAEELSAEDIIKRNRYYEDEDSDS